MQHRSYLFLLAHPDDEIYACVLLRRLLLVGKEVIVVYATSGDAGGRGPIREQEASRALGVVHLNVAKIFFLRVAERQVCDDLRTVLQKTKQLAIRHQVDCIISPDYEGGHEGHDAISFAGAQVATGCKTAQYVFPLYHCRDGKRVGARFKPGRETTDTISLTEQDKSIKEGFLAAHQTQRAHFENLHKASADYWSLLFSREVFSRVDGKINFRERPCDEIGYEIHTVQPYRFSEFQKAISKQIM